MGILIFIFISMLHCFSGVMCTREDMHGKMYTSLNSKAACFRRLNGTHQFGCSSNRSGNLGVVHILKNNTDLDNFMATSLDSSYVIAFNMDMFVTEVMDKLSSNNKVSGVVVMVVKSHIPNYYSPDDVCDSSLDICNGTNVWNPLGNKFLLRDWPFPIFIADDTQTIDGINQCYQKFNIPFAQSSLSRSLCSLNLKSHMSAAVNSPTCLRRTSQAGVNIFKYCDPMGDQNILLPMNIWDEKTTKDVVIVAARLDTASLFDGLAPGAMTSVTSIVTLFTAAHIFSSLNTTIENDKTVIFMLLNGEAQEHIGSSRIVYDIEKGQFSSASTVNLTFANIVSFIEISQVGSDPKIYLHPSKDQKTNEVIDELKKIGKSFSLDMEVSSSEKLPPSSYRVFKKAHNTIPGMIISNYDKEYENKYYNGLLDDADSLGYIYANGTITDKSALQKNIAALGTTLASLLFKIITGSDNTHNTPMLDTQVLVDELLHCYLDTSPCKLIKQILISNDELIFKKSLYVGVQTSSNLITTQTGYLLAYLTSQRMTISKDTCMAGSNHMQYSYIWMNGETYKGVCINTTLKFTPAVSPAFIIPDYNWTSREYSTWTESVWSDMSLEVFLKPSKTQEIITFSCGITTLLLSFLSLYYMTKNQQLIDMFSSPSPAVC